MKLFYFLDFIHLKKYAIPVTYDQYFHLDHGPIPTVIKNLVDEVDIEGEEKTPTVLGDIIKINIPNGKQIHNIVALREINDNDMKCLTPTEIEVLKVVVDRFKNSNKSEIEEESHKEAPWSMTKIGEPIPYTLAAQDPDTTVTANDISLLQQIMA